MRKRSAARQMVTRESELLAYVVCRSFSSLDARCWSLSSPGAVLRLGEDRGGGVSTEEKEEGNAERERKEKEEQKVSGEKDKKEKDKKEKKKDKKEKKKDKKEKDKKEKDKKEKDKKERTKTKCRCACCGGCRSNGSTAAV
ncbi:hypothetical protein TGVAND_208080 [Toxoplasma gondii VAND]|uniref:Uncharacterized protein n=1 Tax=Toxoplasma gondii VAND TaxID=933077 RepID=A0A086PZA3_TOXGO|nr:hypothetical protein TGVAND_208080 [Toxoplasma gondii VAND]